MFVIRIDDGLKAELETEGVVTVLMKNRQGELIELWTTGDPKWVADTIPKVQE